MGIFTDALYNYKRRILLRDNDIIVENAHHLHSFLKWEFSTESPFINSIVVIPRLDRGIQNLI